MGVFVIAIAAFLVLGGFVPCSFNILDTVDSSPHANNAHVVEITAVAEAHGVKTPRTPRQARAMTKPPRTPRVMTERSQEQGLGQGYGKGR